MIRSSYWACRVCISSSIVSICIWTSSGSSGIVGAVKVVESDVEWLICDAEAARRKVGASVYVFWIENIVFSNAGLVEGSDHMLDGSGNIWVLNESIIVFETSWSIALSSSDMI